MGTFLTNLHVRSEDQLAVELALADVDGLPAFVSDPRGGWVTVYPEATETQELAEFERLGTALSAALGTAVIAFLVHDSDVFLYGLFENGEVRDRYDSAPGYFDGRDEPPAGGDVAALRPLAASGTTDEQLRLVLHELEPELDEDEEAAEGSDARDETQAALVASYEQMASQLRTLGQALPSLAEVLAQTAPDGDDEGFAEQLAAALARLLGIDDARSVGGYNAIAASGRVPEGVRLVEPG